MNEWTRIPVPIESDADRRALAAILAAAGLEVRIVRRKATDKAPRKPYIEYRLGA